MDSFITCIYIHSLVIDQIMSAPSQIDLKALNIFINSPVSQDMIHKLVVTTLQVLPCQDDKSSMPSPPQSPNKTTSNGKPLPSLMTFLTKLIRYTNVYTGTLMATLVYLNRLKSKLPKNAQGLPCTRHRILLSCLILSSKYHNDSSPKNVHWAKYTDGLFNVKDINLMERQLVYLLNWDLRVSNQEMIKSVSKFLEPIKQDLIKSAKMRKFLQKQKQAQQQQIAAANAAANIALSQKKQITQPQPAHLQPPNTPPASITRSSSSSSNLSLSSISTSSISPSPNNHYRQDSLSSVESLSPISPCNNKQSYLAANIDPIIELTARNEEMELNRMIQHFSRSNH